MRTVADAVALRTQDRILQGDRIERPEPRLTFNAPRISHDNTSHRNLLYCIEFTSAETEKSRVGQVKLLLRGGKFACLGSMGPAEPWHPCAPVIGVYNRAARCEFALEFLNKFMNLTAE